MLNADVVVLACSSIRWASHQMTLVTSLTWSQWPACLMRRTHEHDVYRSEGLLLAYLHTHMYVRHHS